MIDDAEKYQEVDKERKSAIEGANRADSVVNDTEAALKEYESSLDKAEADAIRKKMTALRETVVKVQSGDSTITAAQLKEQTSGLQEASGSLFDKLLHARADAPNQSQDPSSSTGPESGEKKE